jgi:uncharacterized protein
MSDHPYGPTPPGDRPPGPGGLTQEDRTWALAAHIGALVSAWFAFGFLAPLLVMLLKSDSAFVRRHAVESLNFQISLLIYGLVGTVVAFVLTLATLGIGLIVIIPVVAVLALIVLVLIIMATVKASNGEDYRYPLTLRFVS